jgi:predicted amidohydrolase
VFTAALISDVFHSADGLDRLRQRLREAKQDGAVLAVLPELPLNPWSPATKTANEMDAEEPDGPRHQALAGAARDIGIALVGGAIVRDGSGVRRNTALVFDASGSLVARYAKVHLPEEEGFWETSHYTPGSEQAQVIRACGMPFGVQICSDINRPVGAHILAAHGAEAIVNPRATERGTWDKWRLVFRAVALTTSAYVLSVNRPAAEAGVPIGGPSIVVAPDGQVLVESTDTIVVVTLRRDAVAAARKSYPGYLPYFADVYAAGWKRP